MPIDPALLVEGAVLYKDIKGKRKLRTVTEVWDHGKAKRELHRWGIWLGARSTRDWDRLAYRGELGTQEQRVTRTGLARWADGVLEEGVVHGR